MFETVLLARLFGLPLIVYGGLFTFLLFTTTLILGIRHAPIKIHAAFAIASMVIGLIHGTLAIIAFI
ncbi:Uncharacterised protein [Candidatus Tiddalikarchaeum anstoanum]|nr:Uncharacterised protein [Candidatus Tiddalikarchaeum anstoanum]